MNLSGFLVVSFFLGFSFGFGWLGSGSFGDLIGSVFSSGLGWLSRLGRLSGLSWVLDVNLRNSDRVALSSEASVTLRKDDDAFDKAPDTVSDDGEVADKSDEANQNTNERDSRSESGKKSAEDSDEEAATKETDVHEAFLGVAKIPVVGAEATKENAE